MQIQDKVEEAIRNAYAVCDGGHRQACAVRGVVQGVACCRAHSYMHRQIKLRRGCRWHGMKWRS
jgi:hypothetical protein